MSTTIEQARALSAASKAAALEAYQRLAADPNNEADVSPEDVLEIIERAGRSFDDLLADHEQAERRISLANKLADCTARRESGVRLKRQIAALVEARDKTIAEFNVKILALENQLPNDTLLADQEQQTRNQLIAIAPAALVEQEKTLAAERGELVRQVERCKDNLRVAGNAERRELERAERDAAKFRTNTRDGAVSGEVGKRVQAAVATAKRALEIVQERVIAPNTTALAGYKTRLAEIETELAEIAAAKLKP